MIIFTFTREGIGPIRKHPDIYGYTFTVFKEPEPTDLWWNIVYFKHENN